METEKNKSSSDINARKIFFIIALVYLSLICCFYYLAGDQLLYRNSRGNISMPAAEANAEELADGLVIEQSFFAKIQILNRVSVKMETFYRTNTGIVTVELVQRDTGEILMSGSFDMADIDEGDELSIVAEPPIETACDVPLSLRLSGNAFLGNAVAPMITYHANKETFELFVGDKVVPGTLCFSAEGIDRIWTGLHYWQLSFGLGVILLIIYGIIVLRWKRGKHSYVINALAAIKKYDFLIRQLVGRDFKTKYKRSVLGVFWSFLNPLMMMLVQYFVFSTIFKSDIPYFAAYLIIGTVLFNFFSESCGMSLTSIIGNAGLISKVYMPKYIYPLTRTMSSVINLIISLVPMLVVCLATGVHLNKAAILSLFFFACLILFCLGFGMLLATSMVFFRDTQFLWNIMNIMWMYATPIFYPEIIIPEKMRIILQINPLHHFLKAIRMCILDGCSPEPIVFFRCLLISLGMLGVGAAVFCKNQDRFVLYL